MHGFAASLKDAQGVKGYATEQNYCLTAYVEQNYFSTAFIEQNTICGETFLFIFSEKIK